MHKPFWALGVARGAPDPMHELFVRNGVDAVFTGHWHSHAYQEIDNISYVIVGTAGGAYGGVQDVRRGNAFEFVGVTAGRDGFEMELRAGSTAHPIDIVTLADNQRLRSLWKGATTAVLEADALRVRIENLTEAPLEGALRLDGGATELAADTLAYRIEPGAIWEGSVPVVSWSTSPIPLPRVTLDYSLPDAGSVPWTFIADWRPELRVPAGPAPTLDGALADGEWAGALEITDLTTRFGLAAPGDPTVFWLRHDNEALYLAARCDDAEPGALTRVHAGRDGQVVYDDRIGMLLAADPLQLYWFYVTPNGAVWDLHADRAAKAVHRDWDGVEAAAIVGEHGWSVEARVPFAAMGLEGPPEAMRFDLRRRQVRKQTEALLTPAFGSTDPARLATMVLEP